MACLNPYSPEPEKKLMCRKCVECRKTWRRQWIGRLMAQHYQSSATWFVTLTYGGGYSNGDAYQLDHEHLKKFYSSLRRRGLKFKPVAVGEYGSERGRAHWHVIIFWEVPAPNNVQMDKRIDWTFKDKRGKTRSHWGHGYVQCELPRSIQGTMSYVLQYLDKAEGQRGEFSFGKRPAVGENYLIEFARDRAKAGTALFPRGMPIYQVPGNVKDKGKTAGQLYDYWLDTQSVVLQRMLVAYVTEWFAIRPGEKMPWDKWVTGWAENLNHAEREDLKPDGVRQRLSVEALVIRKKLAKNAGVEFYSTNAPDVVCAESVTTGESELRHYDEEGILRWRESVHGKSRAEVEQSRVEVPQGVYPRDDGLQLQPAGSVPMDWRTVRQSRNSDVLSPRSRRSKTGDTKNPS